MSLDLYSKVEHLLGIQESTKYLHTLYTEVLYNYEIKTLLDVGCGRGDLMQTFDKYDIECEGIDLSSLMVQKAQAKGLKVEHKSICEVNKQYDAIVAVFDVLNFIHPNELNDFLSCVHDSLNEEGIFVFDINTLHGFSNVADGTMMAEEGNMFLCVDALFENNQLDTKFTLFTEEDSRYTKEQATLSQYFHSLQIFKKLKDFKVVKSAYLDMYDTKDKALIVLKKA
ncbi:class I SAM-dependent methyltransferase [Sulfurimonas sp. MAG313]|nr:class I SAM-dependent methyltransferase [Sulfurimonas sp. MAG313]MDF1881517.1 class I SAM-dependent methyltransferase [Sulfurimonas sp. MAG313]